MTRTSARVAHQSTYVRPEQLQFRECSRNHYVLKTLLRWKGTRRNSWLFSDWTMRAQGCFARGGIPLRMGCALPCLLALFLTLVYVSLVSWGVTWRQLKLFAQQREPFSALQTDGSRALISGRWSQALFPCLWAALPQQNHLLASWTYLRVQGLMLFIKTTCLH